MIRKLMLLSSVLRSRLMADARETAVSRYFRRIRHRPSSTPEVVLVQCVEDLYYFGLFGQIVSSLREQRPIRVEQFVLKSLRVAEWRSLLHFICTRLFINRLVSGKWVRLYNSFCDGVGYRSTGLKFSLGGMMDLHRSFRCWKNLRSKDELKSLVIDNVPAGDLINDSYLRFRPAPTVDLEDVYLLVVIWQAYRDIRRAKNYFSRVKPRLYLTSYSTYVQHGVAARVALQCGVRVFSFSNYQEFAKELSLEDWVHTRNTDDYAAEFPAIGNPELKLAEADKALSGRMAGVIDSATAYMKKSAYAESGEPVPDVRGALVIFLHDFYDSPHVYRDIVFPDFWEWICFTIVTLENARIPFFIKPHPNQIDLSAGVLTELKGLYPGIGIISPNITNKQLAEAGLACAVTVYGTVAHEMAYLGIPSITCAHHPHVSFNFCKTARSRKDYAEALLRYAEIDFDKSAMRKESLIFYYMHNLNLSTEEKSLKDNAARFRENCRNSAMPEKELTPILETIAKLPGFQACLSRLSNTL